MAQSDDPKPISRSKVMEVLEDHRGTLRRRCETIANLVFKPVEQLSDRELFDEMVDVAAAISILVRVQSLGVK